MAIVINYKNGDKCETTSRAWWLNCTLDMGNGRLEIARVDAASLTRRRPTREEEETLNVSRYSSSPDFNGRPITYMLGLTAEELKEYGLVPGILNWPNVIDGPRPKNSQQVVPMAQSWAALQSLYNEWSDDQPIYDNTPYHKGDDQP